MSVSFTYSLKNDFPNGLNVKELLGQIIKNKAIISTCLTVKNENIENPDRVDIIFNFGLTAGELRTLNKIVKSHIPLNIPELTKLIVKTIDKTTYESTYAIMSRFIFPGAEFCTITVEGCMDVGAESWSVMIYDYNNHCKLAECSFNNTGHLIHDLGLGQQIPSKEVTLEVFAKVQGGSETKNIGVRISSVKLQFA